MVTVEISLLTISKFWMDLAIRKVNCSLIIDYNYNNSPIVTTMIQSSPSWSIIMIPSSPSYAVITIMVLSSPSWSCHHHHDPVITIMILTWPSWSFHRKNDLISTNCHHQILSSISLYNHHHAMSLPLWSYHRHGDPRIPLRTYDNLNDPIITPIVNLFRLLWFRISRILFMA